MRGTASRGVKREGWRAGSEVRLVGCVGGWVVGGGVSLAGVLSSVSPLWYFYLFFSLFSSFYSCFLHTKKNNALVFF